LKQWLASLAARLPGARRLDRALRRRYSSSDRIEPYRRGHYHSPLPGYEEIERSADALLSAAIDISSNIDLRADAQLGLLEQISGYCAAFDWTSEPVTGRRFHVPNGLFEVSDSVALYGMLRHFAPKQIIEIGSGFSSALMLDTDDLFLRGSTRLTFVEPYPEERLMKCLTPADSNRVEIVKSIAQRLPVEFFARLGANDVLFVDSSHVSKMGSDVNHIVFDVLPALNQGVLVHFHDVFWPFEYPKDWLLVLGRAWNETYLLRAFLQYNDAFEIVLFTSYLAKRHKSTVEHLAPRLLEDGASSLWLRRR
jgi:hypothetical protein